mmetsp:Transcript_14272/g.36108  ORF Transcript_14272/g.36108 Transcript_14272/m.36108 type:complete len:365 (+) Transcript_14272:2165-3259(+)
MLAGAAVEDNGFVFLDLNLGPVGVLPLSLQQSPPSVERRLRCAIGSPRSTQPRGALRRRGVGRVLRGDLARFPCGRRLRHGRTRALLRPGRSYHRRQLATGVRPCDARRRWLGVVGGQSCGWSFHIALSCLGRCDLGLQLLLALHSRHPLRALRTILCVSSVHNALPVILPAQRIYNGFNPGVAVPLHENVAIMYPGVKIQRVVTTAENLLAIDQDAGRHHPNSSRQCVERCDLERGSKNQEQITLLKIARATVKLLRGALPEKNDIGLHETFGIVAELAHDRHLLAQDPVTHGVAVMVLPAMHAASGFECPVGLDDQLRRHPCQPLEAVDVLSVETGQEALLMQQPKKIMRGSRSNLPRGPQL